MKNTLLVCRGMCLRSDAAVQLAAVCAVVGPPEDSHSPLDESSCPVGEFHIWEPHPHDEVSVFQDTP